MIRVWGVGVGSWKLGCWVWDSGSGMATDHEAISSLPPEGDHARLFVEVSQSQFFRDLVNCWRYMSSKWLQELGDGSKNEDGIPPRRAFSGHGQS